MEQIYLFSGLGADHRALALLDLQPFVVVHIQWLLPEATETIGEYAKRLLPQITTTHPIIVGLSFGGIMAIEVSKLITTKEVILISSVKIRMEIPFYLRACGKIGLHHFLPARALKRPTFLTKWFFGITQVDHKHLLKQIIHDTDTVFLKWAIDQILNWNNTVVSPNLIQLHGSADRLLPIRFIQKCIPIQQGGHLMTITHSAEISKIITLELSKKSIDRA